MAQFQASRPATAGALGSLSAPMTVVLQSACRISTKRRFGRSPGLDPLAVPRRTVGASLARSADAMPAPENRRKQSLYFPEEMLREIEAESARQDRSLSWIVQRAWKAGRKAIMEFPSANGVPAAARGRDAPAAAEGPGSKA